jgi:hypothetical protein
MFLDFKAGFQQKIINTCKDAITCLKTVFKNKNCPLCGQKKGGQKPPPKAAGKKQHHNAM